MQFVSPFFVSHKQGYFVHGSIILTWNACNYMSQMKILWNSLLKKELGSDASIKSNVFRVISREIVDSKTMVKPV